MRLPQETTARLALNEHLKQTRKKRGRPKTTWLKTITDDLKQAGIFLTIENREETINILEDITKDRKEWRELMKTLML